MKFHDIPQGSKEWFDIRKMKLTASKAQAIGSNGKGLETLAIELIAEKYSNADKRIINSHDIERGHELEPIARGIYELETGNIVKEVGFIEIDKYTGISPDGLIGEIGGLEIKCLNDINHVKAILYGLKAVDNKYIWQVQMSLLLSKRKWWDLVLFNPNFSKNILIFRITKDDKMFEKLKEGIKKGKKLLKELEKQYGRHKISTTHSRGSGKQ
ncbi:MAG: lambda exonuclease family protein [Parcubacteria group bacterium]|jgi:hypothetical protein